jgi:hypothetical protein
MSVVVGRQEPLLAKQENSTVASAVLVKDSDVQAEAEKRSLCVSVCALAFSIPALIGA